MKTQTVLHHDPCRDCVYCKNALQGIIAVLLIFLFLGGLYWHFSTFLDRQHEVSVHWDGNAVKLRIPFDSVNRVTCLAYDSPHGEALAELPEPMYLLSSGGKTLTESQMKRLIWRINQTGEKTLAPAPGTPIWAMYTRMTWSEERSKKRRGEL